MCGRYTITGDLRNIQEQFDLANSEMDELIQSFEPNYNAAPTQKLPVIIQSGSGRQLTLMRWGLIPSWAKDEKIGFSTINARSEEIEEKPTYRGLIPRQRCLVIADGFYEFRADGKLKHPVRFIRNDKSLFAFAGLYDRWKRPSGETIPTFTILTTKPNSLVSQIHNRMPVILPRTSESFWLDPARSSYESIADLLAPLDEDLMASYDANPDVNNVRNRGAYLIEPIDPSKREHDLFS